jgi:hypothetical protein
VEFLFLHSYFALKGEAFFLPACFAQWGEILFFAPPKKSIQKKGDPGGLPATRVPCASRVNRRSRNSLRSNRARAYPGFHCDARLRQTGRGIQNQDPDTTTAVPFALTEYRSHAGIKARTLSEAGLPAELCAPPEGRGTQGIGTADECTGVPFSLGTFSWAFKRKYLARTGEIS